MGNDMLEINKIHLGNCYDLIKQIPDKSIDCIYIDIPYNHTKGGVSKLKIGDKMRKVRDEIKEISDGIDFEILNQLVRVSKKLNIFIWCSKLQILEIMNFFDKYDLNFEILVWCKSNTVPRNKSWLSDIEYCLFFREKNHPVNNGYDIKSKFYCSATNQSDKNQYGHPTIKPLNLVKRHLLHTTKENDIVLDCFSGSGTTCVASRELNRRFIGIELDENYHKISVDRLNGIDKNGQTSIFTNFDLE